jgi:hypothetical protein
MTVEHPAPDLRDPDPPTPFDAREVELEDLDRQGITTAALRRAADIPTSHYL